MPLVKIPHLVWELFLVVEEVVGVGERDHQEGNHQEDTPCCI